MSSSDLSKGTLRRGSHIVEQLRDVRLFIQDSIDQDPSPNAVLGNLFSARDVLDEILNAANAEPRACPDCPGHGGDREHCCELIPPSEAYQPDHIEPQGARPVTDADLIYNALLRSERRLEADMAKPLPSPEVSAMLHAALLAVNLVREEIGNGLGAEGR